MCFPNFLLARRLARADLNDGVDIADGDDVGVVANHFHYQLGNPPKLDHVLANAPPPGKHDLNVPLNLILVLFNLL